MEDNKFTTLLEEDVVIFSKSWCPFCQRALQVLKNADIPFKLFDIDDEADGNSVHDSLKAHINKTSVPQVFIKGEHLGGCDDLVAAKSNGSLKTKLDAHSIAHKL